MHCCHESAKVFYELRAPHSDHRLLAMGLVELVGNFNKLPVGVKKLKPTCITVVARLVYHIQFVSAGHHRMTHCEILSTKSLHKSVGQLGRVSVLVGP